MNKNKPLINCIIETNKENNYFKFIKVDEEIRNKGCLYKSNNNIWSIYCPSYDKSDCCIYIFGLVKEYDNSIVCCDKEVILTLEEVGCKVIIKENLLQKILLRIKNLFK